jgi:small-conductance mechanosensitive channel
VRRFFGKAFVVKTLSWTAAISAALAIAVAADRSFAQTNASGNASDVLGHLNAAINWYKDLTAKVPAGIEPSDSIYLSNAGNYSEQVVKLAFQSARAQVQLDAQSATNGKTPSPGQPANTNNAGQSGERYAQYEAQVSQRIADDQAEIAAVKKKGGKGADERVRSLEGKLELDKASLDAVHHMKSFVEGSNSGGTGLQASVNELAQSVPEVLEPSLNNKANPATPTKNASGERSGLFGQLITLYDEMEGIRSIQRFIDQGDSLRKIATGLRGPLRDQLSATLQQGKDLGDKPGVTKEQYDAITQRFKGISAALLPLSEELIVLDQARSNLLEWRSSRTDESRGALIAILSRVAVILISIGLILGLAELWRRLTFRYIREPRRRRQFLIVRRVVMGFLISLVILMGFASEFSSLATFAGFVTAGIAVGLQTILLSVAAYFFVIGRYGISVGDRVSVAGVTGDVIDVGLVRFYLMEYASTGAELYPTGRIVVFANSVLFQAATPLFKQLPGTRYTWHEIVVPLTAPANYELVQKALDAAVDPIYKQYNSDPLWHRGAFDVIDIPVSPPAPEKRLQFSDSGPQLVARYPVDLHRAAEIDDKITKALIDAIHKDEKLASAVAGTPRIRPTVK